jgi:hypothetical protein
LDFVAGFRAIAALPMKSVLMALGCWRLEVRLPE